MASGQMSRNGPHPPFTARHSFGKEKPGTALHVAVVLHPPPLATRAPVVVSKSQNSLQSPIGPPPTSTRLPYGTRNSTTSLQFPVPSLGVVTRWRNRHATPDGSPSMSVRVCVVVRLCQLLPPSVLHAHS